MSNCRDSNRFAERSAGLGDMHFGQGGQPDCHSLGIAVSTLSHGDKRSWISTNHFRGTGPVSNKAFIGESDVERSKSPRSRHMYSSQLRTSVC